ncbi:MAG TPA: hypothetical protein H9863_03360 [Candidatus Odoribacter faecigallinarum]|uniref:Uncharacterized protein n=1 Tax=Candidatus Odoribacter faecigallinarum TaxID=2838706 RepID=A0A9D1UZA1_9BACT|nr:hypothetical protein [Candidatus Odoribacter faecigallinarum]
MEKLMYFTTGGLSTLSISNLFSSVGVEWWLESLLSVVGGILSAVCVAWLRRQWERQKGD